jgi:hypothetical protein
MGTTVAAGFGVIAAGVTAFLPDAAYTAGDGCAPALVVWDVDVSIPNEDGGLASTEPIIVAVLPMVL